MSRLADAAYGDRPYPDSPGFKEPTTSRDAARAVAPSASAVREQVFWAIAAAGSGGLTADEAAARVRRTPAYVRPRVTELAKADPPRLVPTGARRRNQSGLSATVWRAIVLEPPR